MTTILLAGMVFWLAYSNGANDNFKGVATLHGSGTLRYRTALTWATLATVAGSALSIMLASGLADSFRGKGLVTPALAHSNTLLIAIAASGAITILTATFLGMPTSTTHALTGALAGIALVVEGGHANLGKLWGSFFLPLLVSPLLAIGIAATVYPVLHRLRCRLGVTSDTCVCVGNPEPVPVRLLEHGSGLAAESTSGRPSLAVGTRAQCLRKYRGDVVGVGAQGLVDSVHALSGVSVCFARAVNDTPKIAVLLLAAGAVGATWKLALVATAMAIGGWLHSRKVAETMSKRITQLNAGQGLTGNLVTAALVLGASRLGVPVSTTHVSCGAIFGIGMVGGGARWRTIGHILLTWLVTLPMGAVLGAAIYMGLTHGSI